MPVDVALRFQDAQFPLPPSARFLEPEQLRLKHPVVPFISHSHHITTASCAGIQVIVSVICCSEIRRSCCCRPAARHAGGVLRLLQHHVLSHISI